MARGFKKGGKFIPTSRSSKSSSKIIGSTEPTGFQMNCPRCGRRKIGSFSKRGSICHCG